MNSAPRSTTPPFGIRWLHTRPPTRSRASSTSTSRPAAASLPAAARPANPAPTTATRLPSMGARLSGGRQERLDQQAGIVRHGRRLLPHDLPAAAAALVDRGRPGLVRQVRAAHDEIEARLVAQC